MTSKHTESEKNTKTQEIKSYLTHEISVLGKTVPTLAIAAIVMIGGASAAVLSSFGTVSGTADVTQAIDLTSEDDFTFATDSNSNDVGETTVTTRTVNNNADVSASYAFETSGAVTGVDSHIFRAKTYQEAQSFNDASIERHYDESSDEWVINVSEISGDTEAIYFDRDFDGTPEFQAGLYDAEIPDETPDKEPRVKVWENVDGTYEGDTRFDPENNRGEFDSDDQTTGPSGEFLNEVSGFIGDDHVVLRIDRSELGTGFQYGLKSGYKYTGGGDADASNDEVSKASFIGPAVQSGASHDLSEGGSVSSNYDAEEGVVEFVIDSEFDGSAHDGAIYFDANNDGTADFQLGFHPTSSGNIATAWKYTESQYEEDTGYNRNDDTPQFGDDPSVGDRLGDLTEVFSGKVNDTHAVVEVDADEIGDKFRYGVKLNTAQDLSTYASGDGEFAQVDTSGFAVVSRGDETLSSGASQDYTFVHDFAINLDPSETYSLTTDVVPVTE